MLDKIELFMTNFTLLVLILSVSLFAMTGCDEKQSEPSAPEISEEASLTPEPEPEEEKELTSEEQVNLAAEYAAYIAEQITAENAEEVAAALEKEIEADPE